MMFITKYVMNVDKQSGVTIIHFYDVAALLFLIF